MDTEIIKEDGDWRVKLIQDDYPDEPYDCGQSPLIRIERGYGYGGRSAEHIQGGSMRPTDNDARIEEAAARWAGEPDLFEKYLRAFHGATAIKWYGPNQATDYTYVTYDTRAWAKSVGFDDEIALRSTYDGGKAVNMDAYIAYLEGDVYVYVVEKKVTWVPKADVENDCYPLAERDTWEHVDSCGGFYGYEYAKEAALEALDTEMRASTAPTGR